jgi:carboxylesterase
LRDVRVPALLIQGRQDLTIPMDSMQEFHARLGSAEKETVWLEKSGHLTLEDYDKEEAFARIVQFVQAHTETKLVFVKSRTYAEVDAEFLR